MLEVLVAGVVFVSAALGSLQLWGAAAAGSQLQQQRQQQRDGLDRDRLLLQQHWRSQLRPDAGQPGCVSGEALLAAAAGLTPSPGVQRQLRLAADGAAVLVQWGEGPQQRRRWYTPEGLGLCPPAGPPNDGPVEGLG